MSSQRLSKRRMVDSPLNTEKNRANICCDSMGSVLACFRSSLDLEEDKSSNKDSKKEKSLENLFDLEDVATDEDVGWGEWSDSDESLEDSDSAFVMDEWNNFQCSFNVPFADVHLEKTISITKVKQANKTSRDIYLEYECKVMNDSDDQRNSKKVQFKPEPNLVTIIY